MTNEQPSRRRTACPRCGKAAGLRFWYLLPSGNPARAFTCASCGGKYDLSDMTRTASVMGALLGVGPGIVVVGKIARHGHGQAAWVLLGTAAAAALFIGVTVLVARLTLRLVPKG